MNEKVFSFKDYKCYVFNSGCIYNADVITQQDMSHLKLVKKNFVGNKKFKDTILNCWKMRSKKILNVGINALPGNPIDKTIPITKLNNFNCNIEFMNYPQEYVYNTIMDTLSLDIKNSGLILKLKAGRGKSFIVARAMSQCSVKTLIIVPGKSILENWDEKVLPHFPNIDVGYYYSNKKKDGDIVIMTIQSSIKPEFKFGSTIIKSSDYFSTFGMVIYDEIHNFATEKYSEILWKTCFRYRIGITATPEDAKFEPLLYFNVGDLLDGDEIYTTLENSMEDVKQLSKIWTGVVQAYKYKGPPEFTVPLYSALDYISAGEMVKQFESDPYRNKFLINTIIELYNNGRNIIVFTEHKAHCGIILQDLFDMGFPGEAPEITILKGGAVKDDLRAANNSKIIIITFGYGKEGISYDHLDTLVFATPRRSKMLQILPRIMRNGGDETIDRLYIDIVDTCTNNFKSQFVDRKKKYKSYNFDIIETKIYWKDINII